MIGAHRGRARARRSVFAGFVLAGAVGGMLGLLSVSASAAPVPVPQHSVAPDPATDPATAPQLSVAITDDTDSVEAGDTQRYTIDLANIGTGDLTGLVVTQTVSEGLEFVSADGEGTEDSGIVSWTVDLTASATATLHTEMTVTETPAELLRLATTACVAAAADTAPIVCASDSDLLPAGADVAEIDDDLGEDSGDSVPFGAIAGGIGALAVVTAAAVVIARRRGSGPGDGTTGSDGSTS